MKKLFLITTTLFASICVYSQQNVHMPVAAKSPVISPDGDVVFEIYAPQAETVLLAGSILPEPADMKKTEEGKWILELEDVKPDLYDYWFEIDGVKTLDPANPYVARDIASLSNIFIIPGGDAGRYISANVAHGTVEKKWYNSEILGGDRRLTVYTPAGYEQSQRKYPVLYLLHGMGGDEDAWQDLGRAVQILDNMIADGSAEPMIVVMPNGNALRVSAPGYNADGMYTPEGRHSADPDRKFEKSFPEIIEFIETNYRVIPEKESRAVAGLSMGGGHSWRLSMDMPDMFDYIGLFSPAVRWNGNGVASDEPDSELIEKLSAQFKDAPKEYVIYIGKEDFLYGLNEEYRNLLDNMGVRYEYIESDGGHTWTNWRHYLVNFLPRLFKIR